MNTFIIRCGPPYHEILLNKMKKDIPSQQVFNITADEVSFIKDKLKYVPIFGDYYLITIPYARKREVHDFIKWCAKYDYIKLVILCNRSDIFLNVLSFCKNNNIEAFKYNDYKATKEDRNSYIIETLRNANPSIVLTVSKVDLIRQRLYGYSGEIYGYLQKLAHTNLTKREIFKIVPKYEKLNANSFGYSCYSGVSVSKLDELIYQYRYYPIILVESLKNYTDKINKLYKLYLTGEFTQYTYASFTVDKGTEYGLNNEYSALSVLMIIESLSFPKLCVINELLNSSTKFNNTRTIINLYKLIRIIQN